MSDHDGHTINLGREAVGETLPKADPIDTDDARREVCLTGTFSRPIALCDEVDRLRMVEAVVLNYEREQIDAHRRRQEAEAEVDRLRAENAALRSDLDLPLPTLADYLVDRLNGHDGYDPSDVKDVLSAILAGLLFIDAPSETAELRAENATLRDLLAKALPWIDPNDRHEDYLLTVAIREALGGPT